MAKPKPVQLVPNAPKLHGTAQLKPVDRPSRPPGTNQSTGRLTFKPTARLDTSQMQDVRNKNIFQQLPNRATPVVVRRGQTSSE